MSETELLLLASKHVLPLLTGVVREIWPGAAHTFLSDYATEPPQLPQATIQPLITDIYPLSEVSRAYHAQESGTSIRNIISL